MDDITSLEGKLRWSLSKRERSRTGKLRLFLEELLQKRFMDSVPMIIPLLVKKYCSTTRILNEINKELRTACVIAIAKARDTFEPFLDQMYGGFGDHHSQCYMVLHNKNRAGLCQFLDSFGGTEQSAVLSNSVRMPLYQESSFVSLANEKHDTKPRTDVKVSRPQFNCFLLMPVIDKLTAFLREDLETAFEDDLDNVF
ncbi:hypothetical protein WN944_006599 [Citrus x changshan-huyou]|uniref:Uncharacterized protein n=1 Tax=Citrus x changshan-huyou TaxID=2935761 RepID=A0AAP0QTE2_9ROSI